MLAAALALAVGCGRPAPPPVTMAYPPKGDTPEARLERVMQRLEFALSSAQGSPEFGVKSQREFRHRLIPPSDDEPRPTAEVTIETRRLVTANKGPKQTAPPPEGAAAEPAGPRTATNVEREKFLLVYDNDRWDLPIKPESETLKICFDSALADE